MTLEEIKIEEFENKIYDKYIRLSPEEEQRDWSMIQDAYKKDLEKFYKIIDNERILVEEKERGKDLVLTIDINTQRMVDNILKEENNE